MTGRSEGIGTWSDYATIKYEQKLTPVVEQIEYIIKKVDSFVENGVLNQGEANALNSKLEAALKSLDKGNTNAACNQL